MRKHRRQRDRELLVSAAIAGMELAHRRALTISIALSGRLVEGAPTFWADTAIEPFDPEPTRGAESALLSASCFFANERRLMPFKPKYNLRRADRQRAQQQKQEEKEQRRQERAAQRKEARDATATTEDASGNTMARKQQGSAIGFVLFDVVYEDGTRSSNRKVAMAELDAVDPDASARLIIEAQDGRIAEVSGRARRPIKSISRSAGR